MALHANSVWRAGRAGAAELGWLFLYMATVCGVQEEKVQLN